MTVSADTAAASAALAERRRVLIFDTTLRDGEQSPGFSMTSPQKLKLARFLADMGVDVLEAGFAAASPDDFAALERIAAEVREPVICSLARAHEGDIRSAGRALKGARRSRIHIILATSPIHREHKLRMSRAEVADACRRSVSLACEVVDEVQFCLEDALRTELDFAEEMALTAVEAGATTIMLPDTVGYATPGDMTELFSRIRRIVPASVVLSTHCHDDLGLACANTLAAVQAGGGQVECAVNGIAERAGLAALEEVVMALKVRGDIYGVDTGVDTTKLYGASRMLTALTGEGVARNKAVVGKNAFAHEAGIHQHGMLKNRDTYEIMRPEDVGQSSENLVMGKHSGRAALADRARKLGQSLGQNQLDSVFAAFKELADRKREVYESDIEALILGVDPEALGPWRLVSIEGGTGQGAGAKPWATVELSHVDGRTVRQSAVGEGQFGAVFHILQQACGLPVELVSFSVKTVSSGEDALGESDVQVRFGDELLHGRGLDVDGIACGAKAMLDVINRLERRLADPAAQREVARAS